MSRVLKQLVIENWKEYGDYMLFAGLSDANDNQKKIPVLLMTTHKDITVYGTPEILKEYSNRLKKVPVGHKFIYQE